MIRDLIFVLIALVVFIFIGIVFMTNIEAHDQYSYTITASIPELGKILKDKEKKYKQILLQAKRDWGETVDAPLLARKMYEMNVAIYNNTVKEMKLLGIYNYNEQKTREEKTKESHNRRYR
jgi:hypothetical protein